MERTLCDILRGSDIQIIGAAMKRYATSKDKNIHRLMQPKAFGFLISTIVGLDMRATMDPDTMIKGFTLTHEASI